MTGRPIRVILDASAVTAFCSGESVGLGEIIAELADEEAAFGIPVAALVSAYGEVHELDLLRLLLDHPLCVLLADDPALWRELAQTLPIVDRYDVASAAVAAIAFGAYVLTRRPGWYAKFADGGPIIEI